ILDQAADGTALACGVPALAGDHDRQPVGDDLGDEAYQGHLIGLGPAVVFLLGHLGGKVDRTETGQFHGRNMAPTASPRNPWSRERWRFRGYCPPATSAQD